jgi:hypothetical protein
MRFVWVWGLRGPEPQKWMPDYKVARPSVIAEFLLQPGEEKLSIDELAKRYPPPLT